jgi:hypothetical protein
MTKRIQSLRHVAPFTAGILIGLSVVTPVFAATLDTDRMQPLVLLGSVIFLVIGLALRARANRSSTRPQERTSVPDAPDLRWRDVGSTIDIALPHSQLR